MGYYGKIETLDHLAGIGKDGWPKVVLCHGCFDLLTVGHIRHLQAAKKLGEVLIVTITPDCYVNKGPGRPLFNEEVRCEVLSVLECVDYVAINKWPTAVEAIKLLHPQVYAKGSEYRGKETEALRSERLAIEVVGGKVVFTDELEFHSTEVLKRMGVLCGD